MPIVKSNLLLFLLVFFLLLPVFSVFSFLSLEGLCVPCGWNITEKCTNSAERTCHRKILHHITINLKPLNLEKKEHLLSTSQYKCNHGSSILIKNFYTMFNLSFLLHCCKFSSISLIDSLHVPSTSSIPTQWEFDACFHSSAFVTQIDLYTTFDDVFLKTDVKTTHSWWDLCQI